MSRAVYISRIGKLLDLKSQMTGAEITVSDVADFVGVTRQTMHAWMSERGVKTLPTAERQQRLEKFFGVSWDRMWSLQYIGNDESGEDPQFSVVAAVA